MKRAAGSLPLVLAILIGLPLLASSCRRPFPKEGSAMQKITPNLWFDGQAEDAARFYTSLFKDSRIGRTSRYGKAGFEIHGQPEGRVMTIEFELEGQKFVGLNGGPAFKFTPAVSFLVACRTKEEVDALWGPLSAGGAALMELGEYPFSEWYGWTQDRYGLSWQVMAMGDRPITQKITPTLMFAGDACGRAEEAVGYYASHFAGSKIGEILRYGRNEEPDREGTIKHAGFTLEGQDFAAMDSAYPHAFAFNEAVSFIVGCEDQEEVDRFWDALGKGGDPNAQQCGWLKDKFGVSWQIVPNILEEMVRDSDPKKVERVTAAFLKMKKLDIAELRRAFASE
jgi:predicted 3-demethylubiquinone-9 3-methyltransferase (glyoxalase superfamily)